MPGRRMRDWLADIEELVEALDLDSFGIVAFSMGGPHALAVGAVMPDRVRAIAVHATPGPWTEDGFEELARPRSLRFVMRSRATRWLLRRLTARDGSSRGR